MTLPEHCSVQDAVELGQPVLAVQTGALVAALMLQVPPPRAQLNSNWYPSDVQKEAEDRSPEQVYFPGFVQVPGVHVALPAVGSTQVHENSGVLHSYPYCIPSRQ
jgi:hypothetical protein